MLQGGGLIALTLTFVVLLARPAPTQDVDANAALFERYVEALRRTAHVPGIAGVFPIDSTKAAASVGVGTWLRMTGRLGVRAEARFIRSVSKASSSRFETWWTTAGVSVRLYDAMRDSCPRDVT